MGSVSFDLNDAFSRFLRALLLVKSCYSPADEGWTAIGIARVGFGVFGGEGDDG